MTQVASCESFSTALESQYSFRTTLDLSSNNDYCNAADGSLETRGRTTYRGSRQAQPLERAESRARRAAAVIELCPTPMCRINHPDNKTHKTSTHRPSDLDNEVLMHLPDKTEFRAGFENPLACNIFGSLCMSGVAEFMCTSNSTTVAAELPAEVLQQIYHNLSPDDFHSARHTCRLWFINSLEMSLLVTMCKRAGIAGTLRGNSCAKPIISRQQNSASQEWFVSKRLSRECALGPNWAGNGLNTSDQTSQSAFVEIANIDCTEIAAHTEKAKDFPSSYTTSGCGKFLMVASDCLVYVYELNRSSVPDFGDGHLPGSLRPVTRVICPGRVMACSMDTSSCRYSIAILLEDRMGMVCDITSLKPDRHQKNVRANTTGGVEQTGTHPRLEHVCLSNSYASEEASRRPFVFPGIAACSTRDDNIWNSNESSATSRHGSISRLSVLSQSRLDKQPINGEPWGIATLFAMPVENGRRSLYGNICFEEDPPRSVAICPQRRCVAFGCSSGIELHWVDALTGQDLNRWFPLTSPSDYLYFLPPREGVDFAKKLRLISSAARGSTRGLVASNNPGVLKQKSPFWQRFGWDQSHNVARQPEGTIIEHANPQRNPRRHLIPEELSSSDHFRAVPLGDGHHILFTDPTTGYLCLGSDAPFGGPTKLLRKVWFEGPQDTRSPIIYTGGSDQDNGIRVVASYEIGNEQVVCLFSVPLDILAIDDVMITTARGSPYKLNSAVDGLNFEWTRWWNVNDDGDAANSSKLLTQQEDHKSIWPIRIRGQRIGRCADVTELTIDSGPDMIIWAFGRDGHTTVWKLDCSGLESVTRRYIMQDGTVRGTDCEGDIEMVDDLHVPGAFDTSMPRNLQAYDGTIAADEAIPVVTNQWPRALSSWSTCQGRYSFEHLVWTIFESGAVQPSPHWTRAGPEKMEADYVARIDIDIF